MQKLTIETEHVRKQTAAEGHRISHNRLEHRLCVSRRRFYDFENFCSCSLLFKRFVALAGTLVEPLLRVGSGWGCCRRLASLGPTRALPLPWLSASTASLHVALGRFTAILRKFRRPRHVCF